MDLLLPRLCQFRNLEHVILEKPSKVRSLDSDMVWDPEIWSYVRPTSGGLILRELEEGQLRMWGNRNDFKVPKLDVLDRWEFAGAATGR